MTCPLDAMANVIENTLFRNADRLAGTASQRVKFQIAEEIQDSRTSEAVYEDNNRVTKSVAQRSVSDFEQW